MEGTHRIARQINAEGYLTNRGALWNSASVRNVLKNPIYIGIRQYGDIQTDRFEHLKIIDDKLFMLAQNRLKESKLDTPNLGNSKYREFVLLPEQVYCMHCGKRLTTTISVKTRTRKDGSTISYRRLKYICINKSSLHPCNGQRSYSVNLIDTIVLQLLQSSLFSDSYFPLDIETNSAEARQKELQDAIEQERISLDTLKGEVVNVIKGTSAFGAVLIRELIQQSESRLIALEQDLVVAQEEIYQRQAQLARFFELRKSLIATNVKDLSVLSFSQQREIANVMISKIELGRGGAVRIEWSFGGVTHLPANESG